MPPIRATPKGALRVAPRGDPKTGQGQFMSAGWRMPLRSGTHDMTGAWAVAG